VVVGVMVMVVMVVVVSEESSRRSMEGSSSSTTGVFAPVAKKGMAVWVPCTETQAPKEPDLRAEN